MQGGRSAMIMGQEGTVAVAICTTKHVVSLATLRPNIRANGAEERFHRPPLAQIDFHPHR